MKNIANKFFLPIIVALALLSSCDNKVMDIQKEVLPEEGWYKEKKVSFQVDVKDTLSPMNIYFMVRNMGNYPYNNLYLFLRTVLPNGKMSVDTVECIMADKNGQWLGKGLGDIKTQELLFMPSVRFKYSGKYTFELIQGMREDTLKGIYEMGIKIEKIK